MIYTKYYQSPLGKILLAEKDNALIGLWIERQKYYLSSLQEEMEQREDSAILKLAEKWLNRYFAGEKPDISELALSPVGSQFRKRVWNIMCEIPYGSVMTYGEIAQQMNRGANSQKYARAVGGAVAHNPISIIIPCHRVVGANRNLTGYAGGIDKKIWLLKHEEIDVGKYWK